MSQIAAKSLETLQDRSLTVDSFIIAGWTGRDRAAVEKHIVELEAIGVPRPSTTPIFYRVAATRVTTAAVIEVTGGASSGEAEFCLYSHGGDMWVGVGSDHTDREIEKINITVSKQMCDKPVAPDFWKLRDVLPHWDRLVLRSFIAEDGERRLYQDGTVAAMIHPEELLGLLGRPFPDKTLMMCGTLAAKGGIRPSSRFDFELHDPVLNRTIAHGYDIRSLPDVK